MQLFLSNESVPHDTPLVGYVSVKGNPTPPKHILEPLSTAELNTNYTHEYLAMCLVTSDQGVDVREWIDHYLRLGVGRFYIFDHSTTSVVSAFADLVFMGVVEYELVPVS